MRKLFFITVLLLASVTAYCDTLDYCHVYYNAERIRECYMEACGEITIKASAIKEGDSLIVNFFSDNPRAKSTNELQVINEDSVLVTKGKGTGTYEPVKVSLWKILKDHKKTAKPGYTIYYYHSGNKMVILFTLKLE